VLADTSSRSWRRIEETTTTTTTVTMTNQWLSHCLHILEIEQKVSAPQKNKNK
jgi:hypothetical protein